MPDSPRQLPVGFNWLTCAMLALVTNLGCDQQGNAPETDLKQGAVRKPDARAVEPGVIPAPNAATPPLPQWETPEEWVKLMSEARNLPQAQTGKPRSSGQPKQARRPITVGSMLGLDVGESEQETEPDLFPQYYNLVATGSNAEFDDTIQKVEAIPDAGQRAVAYCAIARALLAEEAFERAKPWLVEGEKLLPQTRNSAGHEQLLHLYAKAFARSGDGNKAVEVAQQIANLDLREETLISIPGQIAKTGDVEQALNFVETIPDRNSQSQALRQVTLVLAKSNACNLALSLTEQITNEEIRFQALEGIVLELAKAGRGKQALDVVRQILFLHRRPWFLRALAKSLVGTGHLNQALEVAPLIEGSGEQSTYLMEVAIAVAEQGKSKQSLEVVQQIPQRETKENALAKVATALLNAGEADGALEATQRLQYDNQKVRLLYRVASALHSRGEDARKIAVLKEAVAASQRSGEKPPLFSVMGVLSMETIPTEQGTSTQLKSSFSPEERQLAEYFLQAAQQKK